MNEPSGFRMKPGLFQIPQEKPTTSFLHLFGTFSFLRSFHIVVCMETTTRNIQDKVEQPLITYPAEYHIHIQGRLDVGWSDRLAGMSITTSGGKDRVPQTILQGPIVDQSALLGVLNTLHDLGYAVLFLKYISKGCQSEAR